MFGSRTGGGRRTMYKGQDLQASIEISLIDAAKSQQKTFTINGKSLRITIPAGIQDGQKIKLAGHGAEGANNGPKGDLFITFSILPDSNFKRAGNDLHTRLEIDLYTAVLGGETTIQTLDGGTVKLKIKPGTQNNSKIRLQGKGFPLYKKEGEYGDLYLTIMVQIPSNLSEEQKELFSKLAALN